MNIQTGSSKQKQNNPAREGNSSQVHRQIKSNNPGWTGRCESKYKKHKGRVYGQMHRTQATMDWQIQNGTWTINKHTHKHKHKQAGWKARQGHQRQTIKKKKKQETNKTSNQTLTILMQRANIKYEPTMQGVICPLWKDSDKQLQQPKTLLWNIFAFIISNSLMDI